MTKEEAARILDPDTGIAAMCEIEYYAGFRGPEAVAAAGVDALRIAVEALRHKPTGDPLTLEQLRKMDGHPVWVEEASSYALVSVDDAGKYKGVPFIRFVKNGGTFEWNAGGRKLTFYAYHPANIDMEAWTAEWVDNDKSEEMMCKCSKCGYPVSYFWGKTAFCPGCGRAMTPEARAELEKRLS